MRYRVGEEPVMQMAGVNDDMLLFTTVLGLLIGFVLSWLALKGRQFWLLYWGIGLVIASIIYLVYMGLT